MSRMNKTVLLADDSPTIRKIVELTLAEDGLRVESAADGVEAIALLDTVKPDLVLADVVMPGPTGYDLCRRVKQGTDPVPVLLLAGTFEPFDAALARRCGADGQLIKPFESDVLRAKVVALLALERPASASGDQGDASLPTPAAAGTVEQGTAAATAEPARVTGGPPDAGEPTDAAPGSDAAIPSAALVDAVARAVVEKLSERIVREIAWEVVPDLAASIIRERIRELERE